MGFIDLLVSTDNFVGIIYTIFSIVTAISMTTSYHGPLERDRRAYVFLGMPCLLSPLDCSASGGRYRKSRGEYFS